MNDCVKEKVEECVPEVKEVEIKPKCVSHGLNRDSSSRGCFGDRGIEDRGLHTRTSYSSGARGKVDRSCRGSYGVGGVYRCPDSCLDFENQCKD